MGVEDAARQARLATERAARLREEQHQERRELAEKRRLTFQQKVRRLWHRGASLPCWGRLAAFYTATAFCNHATEYGRTNII